MDTRNNQHRKRRVELTNEELQEKRRKAAEYQRQYRARKKAELQNNKTTSIANQDSGGVIVQPSTTATANLGSGLSTLVQIDDSEEPTDWLHKNDNYVPTRREPPITVETGLHIKDTLFSYTMFFNIFLVILNVFMQKDNYPRNTGTMYMSTPMKKNLTVTYLNQ